MKKKVSKILAMILAVVMCMCSAVTVFATENVEANTDNGVVNASYEVMMSTTMTGGQKTGYFDIFDSGKRYYITFTGASSTYVNYTVYNSAGRAVDNGAVLANGTDHRMTFEYHEGQYRIEMWTSTSTRILCVVSCY